ncbi:MAG: hypothetical protein Q9221_002485 [Calogaya cf. arnoldii]
MAVWRDLLSQLIYKPPPPTASFTNKTIIVTGANTGLGKETATHFVRLGAAKVILAVRPHPKDEFTGGVAKTDIEAVTGTTDVVEVYELDYSSYASVLAFTSKVETQLERLDVVVLNAGMATQRFEMFEDNESTITVNVVSTVLLALLLLPIMRASAERWDTQPVLTVVNSGSHAMCAFPERKCEDALAVLNDRATADMAVRYPTSKLLQLFAIREIAARSRNQNPWVTINVVDPGLCYTDISRNAEGTEYWGMKIMRALLAWTAEEVTGKEGKQTQMKIWAELRAKLEAILPGVTDWPGASS